MRRVLLPCALASLLLLSSCGQGPSTLATNDQPANVLAVTVPENLAPGQAVYVYLHWWEVDCGSRLNTFKAHQEGPRTWSIEAVDQRPADGGYICFEGLHCYPYVDSLLLHVPASGTDHYRLVVKQGSIPFDLTAQAVPVSEHRITVLHTMSGAPYDSLEFGYWNGSADPTFTGVTDSTGTAVVTPAPTGNPILSFQNRQDPCGYGTVYFHALMRPLEGRAFHTVAIYDPEWMLTSSISR